MAGKETLYQKLQRHDQQDIYPFHIPGHKRNLSFPGNPYELDITEIHGFDSLHHATGILKEISRRAARLYQAEESYLLVNGSTAGLLCAAAAVAKPGDSILMARNCHRSVYNGAYLNDLETAYLFPKMLKRWGVAGGICPEDVERAIEDDTLAVVVTSPTYEGIVSDIPAIAECCHKRGVPLIVDEAHGAHFGFHEQLPPSAVTQGADIVIQSLHKTMPSLTQTALIHVNGPLADRDRIRRFLSIYQTSSPSYLLMGSIDACISVMEEQGAQLFDCWIKLLEKYRKRLSACRNIRLMTVSEEEGKTGACAGTDPGRLVFSVRGTRDREGHRFSGSDLLRRLREKYRIELEMAAPDYGVAVSTVMDTEEGMERLCAAIEELDGQLEDFAPEPDERQLPVPLGKMKIARAYNGPWEPVPFRAAAGRIMGEFLYLYPPGIPIVVPGEVIRTEHLQYMEEARRQGLSVEGPADITLKTLRVIREDR